MKGNKPYSLHFILLCSLAVGLIGFFGVFAIHSQEVSKNVLEELEISVFYETSLTFEESKILHAKIATKPYVKEAIYTSQSLALDEYLASLDGEPLALDSNSLPASSQLFISLVSTDISKVENIVNEIKALNGVLDVVKVHNVALLVLEKMKELRGVYLTIVLLVLLVTIVFLNSILRLYLLKDRKIILTQNLIGATPRFIRKPYIRKVILWTAMSALIGILLCFFTLVVFYHFGGENGWWRISDIVRHYTENIVVYVGLILLLLIGTLLIIYLSAQITLRSLIKKSLSDPYI